MDNRDDALREGLARLVADDADELIREARADAREAVRARLRTMFERELLARVETTLEPPEPARELGEGMWLYCIAGGDHPGVPESVPGVAEDGVPHVVRAGGISALVSAVPLDEFGEDALMRNLNDLEWLGSMARRHEDVLDAALARGTIVPMRVCTIYRGEEQVRSVLGERGREFREALGWLSGKAEWGMKVLVTRERRSEDPADGDSAGYLARKQNQRRSREQADAALDDALRECHARLEEWATGSELLPAQRRELAGYEGEMVLNAAYLVDDDRADAFHSVVSELRQQYADAGMSFELTGPWPAYHFAGGLHSLEEPVP